MFPGSLHHTKFFLLLVGILLLSLSLNAQVPQIKTSVDKRDILIGEQIQYRVEALVPAQTYAVKWLQLPDSIPHFVMVSESRPDTASDENSVQLGQTFILTSFDSGLQVIPPFPIAFASAQGKKFKMLTDSIAIEVSFSPMDSIMPFHDIKPILEVEAKNSWWLWILLGVLALLLLAILWIVFRKKREPKEKFKARRSDYDEAMQMLRELENEHLPEKKLYKDFHVRLSEIFKRYLSRKNNTFLLHLTVEELIIQLKKYPLSQERITAFAECLRIGNATKFARYQPTISENDHCLLQMRETIEMLHRMEGKNAGDDL